MNPALVRGKDGELYLFARAVGAGNYSRIRMARVLFDANGRPSGVERLGVALEPCVSYERRGNGQGGCEDPRITFLPDLGLYVMAYTAFGAQGARVAIAVSSDLYTWERLGLLELGSQDGIEFDRFENKDAFFFPEPVLAQDGSWSFACMHRPMTGHDHEGFAGSLRTLRPSIWVSYVPVSDVVRDLSNLLRLRQHRLVLQPAYRWEHVKIGGGAPPVLTNHGWLLFHHGIERVRRAGMKPYLRYAAGAFVVDRLRPTLESGKRIRWSSIRELSPE